MLGWPSLRLAETDLPAHFGRKGNIGILVGEASGGLVDVDLDCEEAVRLAPLYLPGTGMVSGRPARPGSHRWYVAPGAVTVQVKDPATNEMIVELRSTGAQTLVGPSVHPDGERYDMLEGQPAVVDAASLAAAVAALARAVLAERGRPTPTPTPNPTQSPAAPALAPVVPPSADDVLRRAGAYLDRIPPAVSGAGGHPQTYAAATAIVHGFGLDPDTAFNLLLTRYNPRCQPPWTEKELRHKVSDAASKPHEKPFGWLRDARDADGEVGVDLSGFVPGSAPAREDDDDDDRDPGDRPVDPGPMPEKFLAVPGFVSEVMEYNRKTAHRWQPALAMGGALCLQAVLAARKVRDERGNRTNVYVVCLAGSGSGKDNARAVNKVILHKAGVGELEGCEDLASDAGLIAAVERQPAILFQIDEFGRWLRTIGDPKKAPHLFNVITTLMKLYSSAKTVFKGKAYADPRQNKVIPQPCVSLLTTTAPEHFRQALTPDAMSDGFMARLIVFETSEMPPRVWADEMDPPQQLLDTAAWWGAFTPGGNLHRENPAPRVVPTTPAARAEFDRLAEIAEAEMAWPREDVRSVWARSEEKACRLALLYACSKDRENPVIDAEAAEWACGLAVYLTRRMLFMAFEYVSRSEFDARQKAVLRAMRGASGQFTRTQFCRATQHLTSREREDIIENLKQTRRVRERTESTGGRPKIIYTLIE